MSFKEFWISELVASLTGMIWYFPNTKSRDNGLSGEPSCLTRVIRCCRRHRRQFVHQVAF